MNFIWNETNCCMNPIIDEVMYGIYYTAKTRVAMYESKWFIAVSISIHNTGCGGPIHKGNSKDLEYNSKGEAEKAAWQECYDIIIKDDDGHPSNKKLLALVKTKIENQLTLF